MQILGGELVTNETTERARGGSEMMAERLHASLPKELLKEFQIIVSRVRELDESKVRVLWLHDLPEDPESSILLNEGWKKFHILVFVSYWQRQQYINKFGIPYSRTTVLPNAIYPIEHPNKFNKDKIRFIYHTTPHRGLEILVPVFDHLCKTHSNIELDVYSSFSMYGWESRDKPYEGLFEYIKNHDKMRYHGAVSNDEIRSKLSESDIFAYPCIWPETGCLSLIEAMSAGLICIHNDFCVLPETSANWNHMYGFQEDPNVHANSFYNVVETVLRNLNNNEGPMLDRAKMGRDYINSFYDWRVRALQWQHLLESMLNEPRELPPEDSEDFVYRS